MNAENLVIGGDSLLGKAIVKQLRVSGQKAIFTTRRKESLCGDVLFLDLKQDALAWNIPQGLRYVFFCAFVTGIEQCAKNPSATRIVNVENTLALIRRFSQKGISVIYPSSNQVFDGRITDRKAEDKICPVTEYGRQKAEVENQILSINSLSSIVRFTKILGPDNVLINGWISKLKQGEIIYPFSDMALSPLHVDFSARMMIAIAHKKSFGIWQVSADQDITYAELAHYIAVKLRIDTKNIQLKSIQESEFACEIFPQHTALDASRLEAELGFSRPDAWSTIDDLYL